MHQLSHGLTDAADEFRHESDRPVAGQILSRASICAMFALTLALAAGCSDSPPAAPPAAQTIDSFVKPEDRLIRALEKQDLQAVKEALAAGIDPNNPGTGKLTPLEFAASKGFVDGGKALLAHHVDINGAAIVKERGEDGKMVDRRGNAALHTAVAYGQVDFVKMLIEQKADVNIRNGRGLTPLDMAKSSEEALKGIEEGNGTYTPSPDRLALIVEQRDKMSALVALLEEHGGLTTQDFEAKKLEEINSGGIIGELPEEIRLKPLPRERDGKKPAEDSKTSSEEKPQKPKIPPLEPLP